jgi:hypothetical protein
MTQRIRMSSRTSEEKKPSKLSEEAFDFAETSDMCDFGYVLAGRAESASAPQPSHSKPSQ